jgi:hypothetical protein
MNSARSVIGLMVGVGMVMGGYAAERERRAEPGVEVILGVDDGLPEELHSGRSYHARISVEWAGTLTERDGVVSVYVSRRDGGVASDTDERWPLVCGSEYGDVIGRIHVRCPFEAPSPGEFALLLEVVDDAGDVVGEGLYAHTVVP